MTTPPVFNPGVPKPKDAINVSQQDFLNNFTALYDAFKQNHIALDSAVSAGNHTTIQLVEQTQQFQTNAGEISIYSKDVQGQTDQLFMRFQGNQTEFQFTNYQLYSIAARMSGSVILQTSYFTFLPGNYIVYFGLINDASLIVNPAICKILYEAVFCAQGAPATAPAVTTASPSITVIVNGGVMTSISMPTSPKVSPYYYLLIGSP